MVLFLETRLLTKVYAISKLGLVPNSLQYYFPKKKKIAFRSSFFLENGLYLWGYS